MIEELQRETRKLRNTERAKNLQRFFKTGKGEYGEGDKFYGLTVPVCHQLTKKYKDLTLLEVQKLIKSKVHEERLIALLILVYQYQKGDINTKENIFKFYLKNTKHINNWDLVDLSAHKIVGDYLFLQGRNLKEKIAEVPTLLTRLAKSKNLWERRIAMISTFAFIGNGSSKETIKIAEILVNDSHDLIHKAVGWALREVGKRVSMKDEIKFLDKHASTMPRTALRYAIERFEPNLRKQYLTKKK